MHPTQHSAGPLTFLVIGTGAVSERHARALSSLGADAHLAGVVGGTDPGKARDWARRHGTETFGSLAEGLRRTDADVVAICTPSAMHTRMTLEALEHGRHVMVEKPAAVSVNELDELIATADRARKQVAVISQHRFDAASETVWQEIRRGSLGTLTSAVCLVSWWRGQEYFDSAAWRGTLALEGGGSLMNQGLHTLDLMLAAMGPATEVQGWTSNLAHPGNEVEDVAVGSVRFASGALGVIHTSTAAYPGLDSRLQIHGDQGSAVIVNDQLERLDVAGGPLHPRPDHPPEESMAHQYRDLLRCISSGAEPRVGLREHREVIGVITGLYEAARSKGCVRLS